MDTATHPLPTRGLAFILAFLSLTVLNLAVAYDATCISVSLPTVAQALHGSSVDAFWTGAAFLLTNTVFQPTWVSISDAFGRRAGLLGGAFFFTVGNAICASAGGFPQLLAGRAIQGLGGAGVVCLSEVIVSDLVPLSERPKYINFINVAWALGSATGPLIGGAIVQRASWRWLFIGPIPVTCLGALMVVLFLRVAQRHERAFHKLKRIDYIGSVTFIGALTSLIIPLMWGGVMYSWRSARTLVPLCCGVAGLICYMTYEVVMAHRQRNTTIPAAIFGSRTACANFCCAFIQGICSWIIVYYAPLYLEGVLGFSTIHTGTAMFTLTLVNIPSAIVMSAVIKRRQQYRFAQWSGWPVTIVGTGVMYMLDVNTTTVQWAFLTIFAGIGLGMLLPGLSTANIAAAPDAQIAIAAGMFPFFRSFGNTVGVAIGGAIFQNRFKAALETHSTLRDVGFGISQDATAVVAQLQTFKDPTIKVALRSALADGLRPVWICNCALAAAGLLFCFFIKAYPMDRKLITEHGWRDGHGSDTSSSVELANKGAKTQDSSATTSERRSTSSTLSRSSQCEL